MLPRKRAIKRHFIFPPHQTCTSFHLNVAHCFANKHTKHVQIVTWTQTNHSSFQKQSTVSTRHDLEREHSILLSDTRMLDVYQVCHGVSRCVKNESCSLVLCQVWNERQWTILLDILLSQQMLDAIKRIVNDNFVSVSKAVHRCILRSTQSN